MARFFTAHRGWYAAAALVLFGLDQWTKALVVRGIPYRHSVPVLPDLFHLTHTRNLGGAFGLFQDLADSWRGLIFSVVPLVVLGFLAVYAYRTPVGHTGLQSGLALIMGGALGNICDRLRLGYVVDFLDFHWRDWHWPAFNLADSSIFLGVVLILLLELPGRQPPAAEEPPAPQAPGPETEARREVLGWSEKTRR